MSLNKILSLSLFILLLTSTLTGITAYSQGTSFNSDATIILKDFSNPPSYQSQVDQQLLDAKLAKLSQQALKTVPRSEIYGYLLYVQSNSILSPLKNFLSSNHIPVTHEYKSVPVLRIPKIDTTLLTLLKQEFNGIQVFPDIIVEEYSSNTFVSPSFATYEGTLPPQVNLDGSLNGRLKLSTARQWLGFDTLQEEYQLYGDGITVGIIDSGVNYTLPAFKTKYNGSPRNISAEVVSALTDEGVFDLRGHGTHVASILIGNGDYLNTEKTGSPEMVYKSLDYRGFLPNADLVSIKVLDKNGQGLLSWVLEGFDRILKYDIDVLNLSFGSPVYNGTGDAVGILARKVWDKGTIIIAAAGNSGPWGSTIGNPAVLPFVISVGAFETPFKFWALSSWGPDAGGSPAPDIAGPGYKVSGINARDGSIEQLTGTSLATPMIVGVVGALKQAFPQATKTQIITALLKSTTDLGFAVERQGLGIINATKAYSLLQEMIETKETMIIANPPRISITNILYKTQIIGTSKTLTISIYASNSTTISFTHNITNTRASINGKENATFTINAGFNDIQLNLTLEEKELAYLTGEITFTVQAKGNDTAFIDFSTYTRFKEGTILFDASKDQDTPSAYYRGDRSDGKYSYLASLLEDDGYVVSTYTGSTLRFDTLKDINILIISDPEQSYSQNEIQLIQNFVADGGILFIFAWGEDLLLEDYYAGNANIQNLNELITPYGMQLSKTNTSSFIIYGETLNSKKNYKVIHWGPEITITDPSLATPIIKSYSGGLKYLGYDGNQIFAALFENNNKGKVFVFGNSLLFNNNNLRTGYGLDDPIEVREYASEVFHYAIKDKQIQVNYMLSAKVYRNEPIYFDIQVTYPNGEIVEGLPVNKTLYLIGPMDRPDVQPGLAKITAILISDGLYRTPQLFFSYYGTYEFFFPFDIPNYIPTDGEFEFLVSEPLFDQINRINMIGFIMSIAIITSWLFWYAGEKKRVKRRKKKEIKIIMT